MDPCAVFSNHVSSICNAVEIPHLVTAGPPPPLEKRMTGSPGGAEFNLHPRLVDLHEAVADVLERANLSSARTAAVVFGGAGERERATRALRLQDALLRRGIDCLASEIRLENGSVRGKLTRQHTCPLVVARNVGFCRSHRTSNDTRNRVGL